jgi:hypothetical protein
VSAFARDLDNTTLWYENIEAVDWRSATPAAAGSRVEFTARFLGRRLTYTYEILELVPGRRLRMAASGRAVPHGDDLRLRGRAEGRHHDDPAQPW